MQGTACPAAGNGGEIRNLGIQSPAGSWAPGAAPC